jgi:hypothetical protein
MVVALGMRLGRRSGLQNAADDLPLGPKRSSLPLITRDVRSYCIANGGR